jgi:NADH:ubiquinone reductase (H+-translocating)
LPDLPKKIVIIGGGFGGLYATKSLRGLRAEVTLIDKRNFHLFQPLLYQVATGGLSPADIAFPLRAIFKKQMNVTVSLAEVTAIDFTKKIVMAGNQSIPYDYLIITTGSHHHYFGKDYWEEFAPGLKTIEDATEIRSRILNAFEKAELTNDEDKRKSLLTFTIVGGGPAGVEMAGAIAELSRHTLLHDFRNIKPADARILLVEGADRILPPYPKVLALAAEKTLHRLGVEILTNTRVTDIDETKINLHEESGDRAILSDTVIWAAGVKASSMAELVKSQLDVNLDKSGRIIVNPHCCLDCDEDVFVIGDLAHFNNENGDPLPGVAPVAMQQGRYVAGVIAARITGQESKPFSYIDKGNLAVIGRKSAVAFRENVRLSGLFAWILWLFVHLMYLVGFENRVLVSIQWAFNYFTRNGSARLITNIKNKLNKN